MLPLKIPRFRRGAPIVVVSGLPRSGTSMAMQMLQAGGVPIMADGLRTADGSNPRGYFEFETVKALQDGRDTAWLKDAGGKAVKVVSFLLTWLPETFHYQVVFMRRDIGEIVASQQKMLTSRGESTRAAEMERMHAIYAEHLESVSRLLARRTCFTRLDVEYRLVLRDSRQQCERIASFLGRRLHVDAMVNVVAPTLYRNRLG